VGLAPYAIYGLLLAVFMIGYLAALARYLCAGPEGQEAMERLMVTSANAIVSILTLTCASPARSAIPAKRRPPHSDVLRHHAG
jgi:hypothetical protein